MRSHKSLKNQGFFSVLEWINTTLISNEPDTNETSPKNYRIKSKSILNISNVGFTCFTFYRINLPVRIFYHIQLFMKFNKMTTLMNFANISKYQNENSVNFSRLFLSLLAV